MNLLRGEQSTSRSVAGLHGTAMAVGSILAGMLLHVMVARYGRAGVIRVSTALFGAGIAILVSSDLVPVTLLGALVCGGFGAVMVNATGPVLTARHGRHAPAAITEGNGVGTVFGVTAPLIIGGCVALGVGWRAGVLVVLPLVAAVLWYGRSVEVPDAEPPAPEPLPGGALPREGTSLSPRFWTAWGVVVMCVSIEFTLSFWTPDLLRSRVDASPGAASAGVFAMIAGMAVGRFLGARMLLRRAVDPMLIAAIGLSIAGFAVLWSSTSYPAALAGLLITGLGLSMHYPLAVSRCLAFAEDRTDLAAARTGLGSGLAVGVAPFALGVLADSVGTHTALLMTPACALAALGLVLAGRRAPA